MAEDEKSQKLVETNKAVAAGVAAVVTAVFTSKLGVAGTLIGTALTATLITVLSAVLKAQFEKASYKVSGIPDTVRGRLSTQQLRIPGRPNPEPNPEPTKADGRSSGLLSRLRAVPGFLRDLPSNQRRKILIAGALAGVVAAVIGLATVTGVEAAAGETLSCLVWSECPEDEDGASGGSSGRSGLSILGGASASSFTSSGTGVPVTPSDDPPVVDPSGKQPPGEQPPGEQPFVPGDGRQTPQQRNGEPAQPGNDFEAPAQEQPGDAQDADPPVQRPGDAPDAPADQASPKGGKAKSEGSVDQEEPSQIGEAEPEGAPDYQSSRG